MQGFWQQQNRQELAFLLAHTSCAESILEVGSCFGRTLWLMALFAVSGAKIRSIDLGVLPEEAGDMKGTDVSEYLRATQADLIDNGFDADVKFGSSHDLSVIQWGQDNGPYDVVFIDGDHTYEGVKADWENYGKLGRVVGFHDIAHPDCGVKRLWDEIKASGLQTTERIATDMGIGIVIRE